MQWRQNDQSFDADKGAHFLDKRAKTGIFLVLEINKKLIKDNLFINFFSLQQQQWILKPINRVLGFVLEFGYGPKGGPKPVRRAAN